jgi:hypothetical protein
VRDDRDDPSGWKIQTLRGQLVELGSAIRQLNRSGLDSATAQLLLSRKRAELEDLIKRGRADARTAEVVRPQRREPALDQGSR